MQMPLSALHSESSESKDYRAYYADNFKTFISLSKVLLNFARMSPNLDVDGNPIGMRSSFECLAILSHEALQALHMVIGETLAKLHVVPNKH